MEGLIAVRSSVGVLPWVDVIFVRRVILHLPNLVQSAEGNFVMFGPFSYLFQKHMSANRSMLHRSRCVLLRSRRDRTTPLFEKSSHSEDRGIDRMALWKR
eukprot:scaffold624_cov150-Cylindrotheca_fusiformis.AAC.1